MPPVKGDNGSSGFTPTGYGVWGDALSGDGVVGTSKSRQGVVAKSKNGHALIASSDGGQGVIGISTADIGVQGISKSGNGVRGLSSSGDGVFGDGKNGVHGQSDSAYADSGVWGEGTSGGYGVTGTSAKGTGVRGIAGQNGLFALKTPAGVWGDSLSATGVVGTSIQGSGVVGDAVSTGPGVVGTSESRFGIGVQGFSDGTGVMGVSNYGTGVYGSSTYGVGVSGDSQALAGHFVGLGPTGGGVSGETNRGIAVYGRSGRDNFQNFVGWAGYFEGNVHVSGFLEKSGLFFTIDHPLDPANKYLAHSSVESPEMKNVYDGVATLDASGKAEIKLPAWFQALNRDFRYQLTPIGAPAPNLHVARAISNNRFAIAGGKARMRVSWQVTGIRKDRWADAHRRPVEEKKSAKERGHYIHPELYGKSSQRSVGWARHSEQMRRMAEATTRRRKAALKKPDIR